MSFKLHAILPHVAVLCIVFLASAGLTVPAISQVPEANVINGDTAEVSAGDQKVASQLIAHCTGALRDGDRIPDACARFVERALEAEAQRLEAEATNELAKVEATRTALAHRNRVLSGQEAQTHVFYYITLVMLAVGVLAAIAHFIKAMRGSEDPNVEVALQKDGFRLKTSMIGFLLLLASMAFYVAYLYAVYPVSAVG
ncbi:MAG: hypothetical protein AAGD13_16030 [Pseudomonadota bacterium]